MNTYQERPDRARPDDEFDGLAVVSDFLPSGKYGAVITLGRDRSWSLASGVGESFGAACFGVATVAEHEAAVAGLFRQRLKLPDQSIAAVLKEVRRRRPEQYDLLPGLTAQPLLGLATARPLVDLYLDGKRVAQLETADLRQVGADVLGAMAAAVADNTLREVLLEDLELDAPRAGIVVGRLGEHWPRVELPRAV